MSDERYVQILREVLSRRASRSGYQNASLLSFPFHLFDVIKVIYVIHSLTCQANKIIE